MKQLQLFGLGLAVVALYAALFVAPRRGRQRGADHARDALGSRGALARPALLFDRREAHIPWLITVPIGFATGLLAATIAVGGFIGVPAMHYVLGLPSIMASATELVIAFIMGLGGTIQYGWGGFVDPRLAMVILAGSLFGVQLGAIGTTYVEPYMVKLVMGIIMLLVLLSRAIIIPVYLAEMGWIGPLAPDLAGLFRLSSFWIMVAALVVGAVIVLGALIRGMRVHAQQEGPA